MCSLGNDDDLDNANFTKPSLNLKKWDKCNKCKSNSPVIILRHKDVYCKECFLSGTVHKFKAFIGKNHLLKKNDCVLVCFRSGHPSVSLLHMLRSGLDLQTPKKLNIQPIMIYIAKTPCKPQFLREIEDAVCSFNFPLYFISLDQYISNKQKLDKILFTNFRQMLENYPEINLLKKTNNNPTATQAIGRIYEQQLLTKVAKYLNCGVVFIPDVSINVATDILTNISFGRGAYVPLDTGVCDTRDPDVTIVRPLRHFDDKELAFYNVYNKLNLVFSNETKKFNNTNVQELMDKFVSNLQINFPATITTVIRTGDKLALDNTVFNNKICKICKAPIIKNTSEELNSATATDFSHWISTELQTFKNDTSFNAFKNKQHELCCYSCSKLVEHINK